MSSDTFEDHDSSFWPKPRAMLDAYRSAKEIQDAVIAAVKRNEHWCSPRCINLLAPEAPTGPAVCALLFVEVGTHTVATAIRLSGHGNPDTLRVSSGRQVLFDGGYLQPQVFSSN